MPIAAMQLPDLLSVLSRHPAVTKGDDKAATSPHRQRRMRAMFDIHVFNITLEVMVTGGVNILECGEGVNICAHISSIEIEIEILPQTGVYLGTVEG